MKKIFVLAVLIMIALSACSAPAPAPTVIPPTAVPPTAVPPTAVPPTAVPPTVAPPTAIPPTATPAPAVDDNLWYRLNPKSFPDMAVDIWNDGNNGVALVKPGDSSGQYYRFILQDGGGYRITNWFLEEKNLFWDIMTKNENRVFMAEKATKPEQLWFVEKLSDGTYRLTNSAFSGLSLDVNASNKLCLSETGDGDGQHWDLTALGYVK